MGAADERTAAVSRASCALKKLVVGQFAAQGVAVDPEHLGGGGLVASRQLQDEFQHGPLGVLHHHVVDGGRLFPVQIAEVLVQGADDGFGDLVLATHAASSSGYGAA